MILKFHIQNYLDKSKKCHTWHSLAANCTYGTLKSGSDLQCMMLMTQRVVCTVVSVLCTVYPRQARHREMGTEVMVPMVPMVTRSFIKTQSGLIAH